MENKTKFTVTEAEKLTGKTRQTISGYIKSGKLSAEISPNGKKLIDLSELHRVFPEMSAPGQAKPHGRLPRQDMEDLTSILRSEIERLVRELDVKQQAQDRDREEYRQEINRLLGIIEKQTLLLPAPQPKKSWLQRIFSS